MNFAIVIPAYNEALAIQSLIEHALRFSDKVIVVNDASTDNTAEIVKTTAALLIEHSTNLGKAEALLNGFNHAKTLDVDYVITLDGDGQHNPDNIPQLQTAYEQYPNHFMIGSRLQNRENAPRARLLANNIADFWVSWAAGVPIVDSQSGFRLYPMSLIESLPTYSQNASGFVFESEVLIDASHNGFQIVFIPIASSYPKQARSSHFRPGFDITRITLMVAKKLFKKGLNLPGLVNSFVKKPIIHHT